MLDSRSDPNGLQMSGADVVDVVDAAVVVVVVAVAVVGQSSSVGGVTGVDSGAETKQGKHQGNLIKRLRYLLPPFWNIQRLLLCVTI